MEKAYRSINENAELLFLPWFWVSANILCVNPAFLSSAKYPSVLAFVLFVVSPGFLCILKRMFLCRQYWHRYQCIFSGRSGTIFVLPNLRSVRQEPKLPTVSLTLLLRKWREIRLASVNNFMSPCGLGSESTQTKTLICAPHLGGMNPGLITQLGPVLVLALLFVLQRPKL